VLGGLGGWRGATAIVKERIFNHLNIQIVKKRILTLASNLKRVLSRNASPNSSTKCVVFQPNIDLFCQPAFVDGQKKSRTKTYNFL